LLLKDFQFSRSLADEEAEAALEPAKNVMGEFQEFLRGFLRRAQPFFL
jgi:hypothetical protein